MYRNKVIRTYEIKVDGKTVKTTDKYDEAVKYKEKYKANEVVLVATIIKAS